MKKHEIRTPEGATMPIATNQGNTVSMAHVVELGADRWAAFNRVLDDPPAPNERLSQLMAKKPPWEA